MTTIKKFALIFLVVDIAIVILGLLFGGDNFVVNSQVAVFCSMFIVLGTFLGYYRNVKARTEVLSEQISERDAIDKIDDPYDLYDEDFKINEQEDFTSEEIKDIINEEKNRFKGSSVKNTLSTISSFASIYRIAGYALLVVGFFFLKNNEILNIYGFLVGVSIVPVGTLLFQLKTND
jgi:Ca2+/Na+ antiporter